MVVRSELLKKETRRGYRRVDFGSAPSALAQTRGTPLVRADLAAAAKAASRGAFAGSTTGGRLEAVVGAPGTAAAAGAVVVVGGRVGAAAAGANGDGQALDDAGLALPLARVHAVVDGKVAANHVGAGCGSVACQLVRLVGGVGRVFAIVDADGAGEAATGTVAFVERVGPMAALAEACGVEGSG